jgi:MFS family permease
MASGSQIELTHFDRAHRSASSVNGGIFSENNDHADVRSATTRGFDNIRSQSHPDDILGSGSRSSSHALEIEQTVLPRADGGLQAWLFLTGCFMIEALVWGFPFSFGVFQEYYTSLPLFESNNSGIAIIGTSASGVMYLGASFVFFFLQKYPHLRVYSGPVGLAIITLALIGSSFSTEVWHLIVTQGVLYAIGGCLLYSPTIIFLDEWFITRKGLAYGIMWAGTGVSGAAVPIIMTWGLEKYGFRTMLRAWALALIILAGPLTYFVKARIPLASGPRTPRPVNWQFLRHRTFWLLQASNVMEGFGFFIPGIYLPLYARHLGLSTLSASTTLVLMNSTSVLGQVGFGFLIDKIHVTSVVMISTIGATLSVLVFWGLSASLPLLYVFAAVYGIFGAGFTSTYSGMIKEVQKRHSGAEAGTIFGMLAAGRGIGAVASGPISEALLSGQSWAGEGFNGYHTPYAALIVFTGVTALFGGVSFVARQSRLI